MAAIVSSELFDGVFVCTGLYGWPFSPPYAGSDSFQGVQCHAVRYRSASDVQARRVVVVGMGNSGADIACELSLAGKQVSTAGRQVTLAGKQVSSVAILEICFGGG